MHCGTNCRTPNWSQFAQTSCWSRPHPLSTTRRLIDLFGLLMVARVYAGHQGQTTCQRTTKMRSHFAACPPPPFYLCASNPVSVHQNSAESDRHQTRVANAQTGCRFCPVLCQRMHQVAQCATFLGNAQRAFTSGVSKVNLFHRLSSELSLLNTTKAVE